MTILLNADLSTGDLSQLGEVEFKGVSDSSVKLSDRLVVAHEIDGIKPAQGNYLARFEVRPGDQYMGSTGWRFLARTEEPIRGRKVGETVYYVYAVLVPSDWPGDANIWIAGMEWHNAGGAGSPAPHHMYIYGDHMRADLWGGSPTGAKQQLVKDFAYGYQKLKWHIFACGIKMDRAPNAFFEAWHGCQTVDQQVKQEVKWTGVSSLYDDTDSNYGLFGIYRGQEGTSISHLYFGGYWELSSMQEAVDFANKLLTGSVTPPPPPPPINGINLRVVKQDSKYIYFEWDQVAGAEGYLYLVNGRRVSRTFDPLQTHTRFAYDATAKYEVVAVNFNELARGAYSPSA